MVSHTVHCGCAATFRIRSAAAEVPPLATVIGGSRKKFIGGLLSAGNQAAKESAAQRDNPGPLIQSCHLGKYFGWSFGAQGS